MRYGLAESNSGHFGDRYSFPAQSSVLDEEALFHRIVAEYDIPEPKGCVFFSRGDSDIYRVQTGGPTFYLKLYRPPVTVAATEAEASLVAHLSSHGVGVVRAVRRRDGTFASEVAAAEGPRPILLFEAAPHAGIEPLNEQVGEALGNAVAELHAAADSADGNCSLPTLSCDSVLRDTLPSAGRLISDVDRTELDAIVAALRHRLRRIPTEPPGFGLCHCDLVLSNIRKGQGGSFVFFDFGNAAFTWRASELAVIHQTLRRHASGELYDEVWSGLLRGYRRTRELPDDFSQHLPLFDLLRKVSWICGVMASCPLRMGTETFNPEWVSEQMPSVRELARCLAT